MKVLTPGHRYELENFEAKQSHGQIIQFIQKEPRDGTFATVHDGPMNEEVLRVLIDRLNFLNQKAPCRENSIAITKLQEALFWLEHRTIDRKARGVEGTP